MIHKALRIIELVANSADSNSLNTISRETGISRSSVHRILTVLRDEGIVTFIPQKGYRLTPRLFSLCLKGLAQKDLLNNAIPVVRSIAEKTKETVSLNVICGYERICVYSVVGDNPIAANSKIGDRGPLLYGSGGRIIASGFSQKELQDVVEKALESGEIQEDEIPDILDKIEQARKLGYSLSIEERFPGCASLGVPVRDLTGTINAALTISTIVERMTEEKVKEYIKILIDGAAQIEAI